MKKLLVAASAVSILAALGGSAMAQEYTLGISNTVQGNGWR